MQSGAPSVLVVDDDPDAIFLLESLLNLAGVEQRVATAFHRTGALAEAARCLALEETERLMVWLDRRLGLEDGLDVLRELRSQDPSSRLVVFVMSASITPEDLVRCYQLGADAVIPKYPAAAEVAVLTRAAAAGDYVRGDLMRFPFVGGGNDTGREGAG